MVVAARASHWGGGERGISALLYIFRQDLFFAVSMYLNIHLQYMYICI